MTYGFAPLPQSRPPIFPKPIHFNGMNAQMDRSKGLNFQSDKLSLTNDMFVKSIPQQEFYPTHPPIGAVQAIASSNKALGNNLNTYG